MDGGDEQHPRKGLFGNHVQDELRSWEKLEQSLQRGYVQLRSDETVLSGSATGPENLDIVT